MSRVGQLEARRLALLARCDQQRFELAYRVRQLTPGALLSRWTRRAPASAANHPLRWVMSLATLIILLRQRRLIGWVERLSVGAAVISRAAAFLRLFRRLQALRGATR
jgi:hypothetical protein